MKSFENMKKRVIEQPILMLPNFNKVFQVDYDASGLAIRAVLSQEEKLITFFTKKWNDDKKQYYVYDRELFYIVHAYNKW